VRPNRKPGRIVMLASGKDRDESQVVLKGLLQEGRNKWGVSHFSLEWNFFRS
jgi:hypothetical protein